MKKIKTLKNQVEENKEIQVENVQQIPNYTLEEIETPKTQMYFSQNEQNSPTKKTLMSETSLFDRTLKWHQEKCNKKTEKEIKIKEFKEKKTQNSRQQFKSTIIQNTVEFKDLIYLERTLEKFRKFQSRSQIM